MTKEDLRVLLGGQRGCPTACGIVSQSVTQTGWAVQQARMRVSRDPVLKCLTDLDVAWLLTRGWTP